MALLCTKEDNIAQLVRRGNQNKVRGLFDCIYCVERLMDHPDCLPCSSSGLFYSRILYCYSGYNIFALAKLPFDFLRIISTTNCTNWNELQSSWSSF
jgi:hypothetical protein